MTGTVLVDEIAAPSEPSRVRVDSVHFAPGSRTVWHRHPYGQTMLVTAGTGLVQRRGGPVETVRTGDVVHVAPDEWHWHGATPGHAMSHLAIQRTAKDGTEAERGEPVSDGVYPNLHSSRDNH